MEREASVNKLLRLWQDCHAAVYFVLLALALNIMPEMGDFSLGVRREVFGASLCGGFF